MRGKVDRENIRGNSYGITPAYAGKSTQRGWAQLWQQGSPPRMRGKALRGPCPDGRRRITPAYAGKRPGADVPYTGGTDHPRVCGEKWMTRKRETSFTGSPPRMRGKAPFLILLTRNIRITPAYAGKSAPAGHTALVEQDHPRVCGEKATPPLPPSAP